MLQYGIGALLIVLIITITLSYYQNAEGFVAITASSAQQAASSAQQAATAAAPAAAAAQQAATAAAPAAAQAATTGAVARAAPGAAGVAAIPSAAVEGAGIAQLYKADTGDASLIDRNAASQSSITTNSQGSVKIDRVVITTTSDKNYLYIYASAELIPNGNAMKYWLITENENDPAKSVITLSRHVFVSNDPKFKSASIPVSKYAPYAGQSAYLVPEGKQTTDLAVGEFIIPSPSGPTIVNPKVSLSDTGCNAMKLNKQSNLLNDIQKIIHNEMLANRSLDVIVKNPNNRGASTAAAQATAAGPAAATAAGPGSMSANAQLPPNMQAKARKQMQKKNSCRSSCNNSCGGTCDSCRSDNDPDMSKYIRKDQIPCWGCSLDY